MSSENLKRRGSLESLQTLAKVPKIKDDNQVINVKEKLDDIENETNLTKPQVNVLRTSRDTSKAPIDNVRSANKECEANTKASTANMFTKKDLFWSVKGLYPDVKIGKSLTDYKKAVAEYLAAKFELFEDNPGLQKFVKKYAERISTLLKKFHRNFSSMVVSADHTEFFGTSITLQSFELFLPPNTESIDPDSSDELSMSSYLETPQIEMTRTQELEIKVCNLEKQVVSL